MSDTPFMPLWVADFLRDTLDLDAKEVGAYMLILMAMWSRDGKLPNDQKKLQRVSRCGREWPKVWAAIEHYFTVDGDTISQGRLTRELQKVAAKREVNAQSGARGGRAKALKYNKPALANATVSPKQPEPYSEREEPEGKPSGASPSLFDVGLMALTSRGVSDKQARSITGMWRSQFGEPATLEVFRQIEKHDPSDPVAYGNGILRKKPIFRDGGSPAGAFGFLPERN